MADVRETMKSRIKNVQQNSQIDGRICLFICIWPCQWHLCLYYRPSTEFEGHLTSYRILRTATVTVSAAAAEQLVDFLKCRVGKHVPIQLNHPTIKATTMYCRYAANTPVENLHSTNMLTKSSLQSQPISGRSSVPKFFGYDETLVPCLMLLILSISSSIKVISFVHREYIICSRLTFSRKLSAGSKSFCY